MTSTWASVALGGTKCTVAVASLVGGTFRWLTSSALPTTGPPQDMLGRLTGMLGEQLDAAGSPVLDGIGIVCGSPLDEPAGLVLAPPNLPDWQSVDVLTPFRKSFRVQPKLMNDADAGALAEWSWGAARGTDSCVFLTLGTGLGAGLILNRQLYRGARGLAGEIGHWRLEPDGPAGHGKAGSFEGFCSGSGIGRWARRVAAACLQDGTPSALAADWAGIADVTAERAGMAADRGDVPAQELWAEVGRKLGAGLALLIDVLNPDAIVLGGIYVRQMERLAPPMREVLEREALPSALGACRIEPSALGERIGEWSGLAAALLRAPAEPAGRPWTTAAPRDVVWSIAIDGQVTKEGSGP